MNCPLCNNPLVDVVYGFPTMDMIEKAKNDEIVLGGTPRAFDFKPTHYCLECQEQYPAPPEDDTDRYNVFSQNQ
jgi:hypothetical protein